MPENNIGSKNKPYFIMPRLSEDFAEGDRVALTKSIQVGDVELGKGSAGDILDLNKDGNGKPVAAFVMFTKKQEMVTLPVSYLKYVRGPKFSL